MMFFSGFSLRDESRFFDAYLLRGDYSVAGFSYGAILAAEHVLDSAARVDTLQLFSPAFFQETNERYKRLQIAGFKKDPQAYISHFIQNCFAPYGVRRVDQVPGTSEELEALLHYEWKPEMLRKIAARGTRIEVYLGAQDRIIDSAKAREFFTPLATVTTIQQANHFLQEQS